MVGKACLPSNAYYLRTPDYTLYSGVHVCWSEHSDSSFVYGFMSLDYGLGTMTTTTKYFKGKSKVGEECISDKRPRQIMQFDDHLIKIGLKLIRK